jgi:hypothetical protein
MEVSQRTIHHSRAQKQNHGTDAHLTGGTDSGRSDRREVGEAPVGNKVEREGGLGPVAGNDLGRDDGRRSGTCLDGNELV